MLNQFIEIQTNRCRSCWKCVDSCPNKVLGKVNLPFHKHVKMVHPENCIGCFKCEKKCEHGAIARRQSAHRAGA